MTDLSINVSAAAAAYLEDPDAPGAAAVWAALVGGLDPVSVAESLTGSTRPATFHQPPF